MKNHLTLSLITFIFTLLGSSTAQVRLPPPSPTQTIKQEFGLGSVQVTYSRPRAKGRKVFGVLVPYDKLWRTGANAATQIKFSDPVEIGGKKVDSGTYVLYTIPRIDSWDIIINKGISNWGTTNYKESEDVIRLKAFPVKIRSKVENFTIQFANISTESCDLNIIWEKTSVTIPITTNVKEMLRTQVEAGLLQDKKPYWQAAQFYNEYDHNLNKALDYVTKALTENQKAYWIWLYKAKIQKEMGDNPGARISSKRSMELASEEKNEEYIKMNEDFQRKLK